MAAVPSTLLARLGVHAPAQTAGHPIGAEEQDVAQTRPDTVCSIIDARSREVGLAVLDLSTLSMHLIQFVEAGRSSVPTTAMLLASFQVTEAVVLAPNLSSKAAAAGESGRATDFMQQLEPHLPETVYALPRSAFDDVKGRTALETYATPASMRVLASAQPTTGSAGLYLAMGAAGALLHHLLSDGQHLLMAGTLTVKIVGTQAHMQLSAGALECLEIMPRAGHAPGPAAASTKSNNRSGTQSASMPASLGPSGLPAAPKHKPHLASHSLFDCMNHTTTSVGARLLRASLLQPLTDTSALDMRYDAVQELLENSHLQLDVAQALALLPKKLDRLCSSLVLRPPGSNQGKAATSSSDPSRRIAATITAVLLLRSTLQLVPQLADCLAGCQAALLQAGHTTCSLPEFGKLLSSINEVIDPDATLSTSAFVNRIQQCFAVKAGIDQMLDVARTSFCKASDKVHALAEQYQAQLPAQPASGVSGDSAAQSLQLKVNYSDRSGFFFAVTPGSRKGQQHGAPVSLDSIRLPRLFIPLEKRSRTALLVTTQELQALNTRLRDMSHDCLLLTEQVMDGLMQQLAAALPLLLRLVDCVAVLDLLASHARLAATASAKGQSYCRPQLHDKGHVLAVSQGRHPLLEQVPGCSVQPNDIHIDGDCASLHIITGPNMAGKSTLLKQVGLLVVMAQSGSLVPARWMHLRPITRLFTRMGHGDSIETNSSSFMVEMQEVAHILDCAGPRSLVLVDELGRATSTSDGVAVCWAVCEALLASRSPCLFATHLSQLAELVHVYPNAKLWALQVQVTGARLDYTWRMAAADTSDTWSYGLALAATLGFPQHLLEEAKRVAQLQLAEWSTQAQRTATGEQQQLRAVYSLASKLMAAADQAIRDMEVLQPDEECPVGRVVVMPLNEGRIEDAAPADPACTVRHLTAPAARAAAFESLLQKLKEDALLCFPA